MKKRPKGRKYRNLTRRGVAIYYQRRVGDHRLYFSLKTSDWDRAAAKRNAYEEEKGIDAGLYDPVAMPDLAEFASRYLAEDTAHLATTTKRERENQLKPHAPLLRRLGHLRLDEIRERHLREWWGAEVEGNTRRSPKTGRNYIDALAGVLGYARDLGLIDRNPVYGFREILARKSRTKRGRVEAETGKEVRPIEKPEEIEALLAAARDEGLSAYALVTVMLDAGLRWGEAHGLRWRHILWGDDEDGRTRALLIEENRPRGGAPEAPKSGRGRRVGLSLRLREVLATLRRSKDGPPADAHLFPDVEPGNFRNRAWRRILEGAGIGHRRMKDLRDTYASQLISAGVPLGYVSAQLGHANLTTTSEHYTRYVSREYVEPPRLRAGEIPADLLARLWCEDPDAVARDGSDNTSDVTSGTAAPTTIEDPCDDAGLGGVGEGTRTPDFQDHNLAL